MRSVSSSGTGTPYRRADAQAPYIRVISHMVSSRPRQVCCLHRQPSKDLLRSPFPGVKLQCFLPCARAERHSAVRTCQNASDASRKVDRITRLGEHCGDTVLEDLADLFQATGHDRASQRHVLEQLDWRAEEGALHRPAVRRYEDVAA